MPEYNQIELYKGFLKIYLKVRVSVRFYLTYYLGFLQDVTEEIQPSSPLLSPSHSSITKKIEELESGTDVSGRPSPVSVLDTRFLDEDLNPGYSRCQAGKLSCTALRDLSSFVLES